MTSTQLHLDGTTPAQRAWMSWMPPIPLTCAVPVRTTQDSWIVVGEPEAGDDDIDRALILKPESECSPTSIEAHLLIVDLAQPLGFAYALRWCGDTLRGSQRWWPAPQRWGKRWRVLCHHWIQAEVTGKHRLQLAELCRDAWEAKP